MDALDPEKHATPLSFFLATNRAELKWIALNTALYGAGSLMLSAVAYLLGQIVDILTAHAGGSIRLLLVISILCLVSYEIFYRFGHMCEVLLRTRVRRHTKEALFDHSTSLSFGYFTDRFAGEIAHKIAVTADAFEQLTITFTNHIFEAGILVVASIIMLNAVQREYGLFTTLWSILLCIGLFFIVRNMDSRAREYASAEARTTGIFVDIYTNIGAVKLYGPKSASKAAYEQIASETNALRRLEVWDVIMFHYEGWFMILLGVGLIWISIDLYREALIKIGDIVFILAVALRLYSVMWELGPSMATIVRFRGEAQQNLSELVVAPAILDGNHTAVYPNKNIGVEYRDVTFGYAHERSVLKDFSLVVQPGEKIGIVGLSGAGKTTFANLLLRFFDAQGGAILLNGEDIRDFTQEFLRSHISYISQDTSLFHATIAENIAYGAPAASREDIEHAAHLAYADEFIAVLANGYESVVGERGIKLSGGQRQRIAIARAILADRPLFLLDEATSALDSDSESKIQKGLVKLMEGKTVIAIAHRLSTLSHMDRIIFLEAGTIAEDGTHEELLARSGKYAALWRMQAGGFLPDELEPASYGA